jgi:hypothetical protein
MSAAPPRNTIASTVTSAAQRLGALFISASARNGGEKIIACGSAICGWPLNTKGAQNGESPLARLWARNWICGWKCALASQGMVTRPDSQGQPMTIAASPRNARG